MKKQLLLLIALMSFAIMPAQSVGIIGSATPTGWDSDTDMATTDNVIYTINMTFVGGEAKFRQDDAWTINWGATTFPTGTGTQGGANIPVPAGTYDVTFNRITGEYSFVGTGAFDSIGVWGPAVDAVNGFAGPDVDMATTDGISYILSAFTFSSGVAKFRKNDDPLQNYGSTGFPTGTAVADGPNFFVPGGEYTVYFNLTTGAYSFEFPSVGYLGTVLATGFDGPDVNLATSDGVNYTGSGFLEVGELKFRLDDSWSTNWGGAGLAGTAEQNGANIAVPTAANYSISFNRSTLEYSISEILAINEASVKPFNVYPNPTLNSWNFSSNVNSIQNIQIFDVTGKMVLAVTPESANAVIDASAFTNGVYFAKVTASNAVQTIKLVKE